VYRRLISESLSRRCTEKRYQNSSNAKIRLYQSALQNCSYLEERLKEIETQIDEINKSNQSNNEKNRLIQEKITETKQDILTKALHSARQLCIKYKTNINNRRSQSPRKNYNTTIPNNNNKGNKTRGRARGRTRGNNNND